MGKITVIIPTNRLDGLEIVHKALKKQTFKDFQVIWICPKEMTRDLASKIHWPTAVGTPPGWYFGHIFPEPDKREGDVWALNKAYNYAVKHAMGELIVSWQDFTYAKPDTLERFWNHYMTDPHAIVGAVGNKYADDTWTVQTWKDPREREDLGTFYEVYPSDVEWNLCAVPKQALYDVGGFDEELDKYYGMDGYSVNIRIDMLKEYRFFLDQSIKTYSLEHGRVPDWEEKNAIHGPYQERAKAYLANPKLEFLK